MVQGESLSWELAMMEKTYAEWYDDWRKERGR